MEFMKTITIPRTARRKSKTGINHIIFRGINYLDIFLEKDDFEEYIYRLGKISMKYELEIYAYCLMTNHVHLLIKEGIEDISASLKRLEAKGRFACFLPKHMV
jgi:REP element-mobilizing transposase RayT